MLPFRKLGVFVLLVVASLIIFRYLFLLCLRSEYPRSTVKMSRNAIPPRIPPIACIVKPFSEVTVCDLGDGFGDVVVRMVIGRID